MIDHDQFVMGDRKAICDVCGFQYKHSQLSKRWDGLMVCSADFESRHPQDMVKPIRRKSALVDSRPEPDPVFVEIGDITPDDL